MRPNTKAYLIGGGIGSLAAAAFMIRDGKLSGKDIVLLEAASNMGGSLYGTDDARLGYSMLGGRLLSTDNYECTWDLFKSIPSTSREGQSVYDETIEFNQKHRSYSIARLIDRRRARVPVTSMGLSMQDRIEVLNLSQAEEVDMAATRITDWLSPAFFESEFWLMWSTTFAFLPWHSAVEFRRYLHRFMPTFSRIETLTGVMRTIYNQYDSLVVPLQSWLQAQGMRFYMDCQVTNLDHKTKDDELIVTGIHTLRDGRHENISVKDSDFVLMQNASITDAFSLGSMSLVPTKLTKADSNGWKLWEQLAKGRPQFGNPLVFNSCIAQSCWESFTITLKNPVLFEQIINLSGNEAGSGALLTFKDSNWLMSIVLAHQPHFLNQPTDVQVFWGYALFPDRIGNFVAKSMSDCTGAEILLELCGHLRFDLETLSSANCIPCRMPYITSVFMPHTFNDRPFPVPRGSKNLGFISQFVEIPQDVVFTFEYSIRAAQMAVYQLLGINRPIPPVAANDKSLQVEFETLIKDMK